VPRANLSKFVSCEYFLFFSVNELRKEKILNLQYELNSYVQFTDEKITVLGILVQFRQYVTEHRSVCILL